MLSQVLSRFSKSEWTEDERRWGREQGRQELTMGTRLKQSHAAKLAAFLSVKTQVWSSSAKHTLHSYEPSPTEGKHSL